MEEHKTPSTITLLTQQQRTLADCYARNAWIYFKLVYYTIRPEVETKSGFVGMSDTTSIHESWSWKPYVPIGDFLGTWNTVKMTSETVKLILFHFFLKGKAIAW